MLFCALESFSFVKFERTLGRQELAEALPKRVFLCFLSIVVSLVYDYFFEWILTCMVVSECVYDCKVRPREGGVSRVNLWGSETEKFHFFTQEEVYY